MSWAGGFALALLLGFLLWIVVRISYLHGYDEGFIAARKIAVRERWDRTTSAPTSHTPVASAPPDDA